MKREEVDELVAAIVNLEAAKSRVLCGGEPPASQSGCCAVHGLDKLREISKAVGVEISYSMLGGQRFAEVKYGCVLFFSHTGEVA